MARLFPATASVATSVISVAPGANPVNARKSLVWLPLGVMVLLHLAGVHACSLQAANPPLPENQRPPNLVLIISDDQGWTDFGFMGHPDIRTPRIDQLAAESVQFPHGYVPTSLCRASLATLLTGQYGHQHRICCNDPPEGVARTAMHPFIQQAPALPRLLARQGYLSLQTGKFWEGHFSNAGFTHGMTVKGRHGDDGLKIGRDTFAPVDQFLDEAGSRPFFLWYAPMLPHEPHNPPDRLLRKYQRPDRHPKLAAYYAMCEWFDETVGTLLDKLDDRGLRDNTMVLFTVDNGWIQETGETRTTRGWFAPKSKLSPYDGGLRFPLLIRWPGQLTPDRRDDLVSSIDVVPTLLAAAGAPLPADLPGLNLLPHARAGTSLPRSRVFGEIFEHTATNLKQPALDLTHRWVREGDWKLILFESTNQPAELYNLRQDPFEQLNLSTRHPDRVAQLKDTLNQWWAGRETTPAP